MVMVFDFFIQVFLAALLFAGIGGAGYFVFSFFKLSNENVFFRLGSAYFISLCLYVFFAVLVLFVFPNKLFSLVVFSLAYFGLSFWLLFLVFKNKATYLNDFLVENRLFFGLSLAAILLFFLQIYHTSILDEWLHRPVVKFFTENGIFPLMNPHNANAGFIYTYHYGSQIIASTIKIIFNVGVSEALDVFKLANALGSLAFFYGILVSWVGKKWIAALGSFSSFFLGSSFFLLDSFSVSHIFKTQIFESQWPFNTPLSFGLTGITGVGNIIFIALSLFLQEVSDDVERLDYIKWIFLSILFSGFFLLSELFAALLLIFFCALILKRVVELKNLKKAIRFMFRPMLALAVLLACFYYTGGIIGISVREKAVSLQESLMWWSENTSDGLKNETAGDEYLTVKKARLLSLKSYEFWGYPSEKSVIVVWENKLFYLRNFLLEMYIFAILVYLVWTKKAQMKNKSFILSMAVVGILTPFFFSTSFGDLNLLKLAVLGFIFVHIISFYLIFLMRRNYFVVSIFIILVIFGSIPGMLLGPNIQCRWTSKSKGRSQYCSQNPLCYKEETKRMFDKFEKENPGIKTVLVATSMKDAQKVVDLSNSKVIFINRNVNLSREYFEKNNVTHVYYTENFEEIDFSQKTDWINDFESVYTDGRDEILKLEGSIYSDNN